jgi:hypothetical protein
MHRRKLQARHRARQPDGEFSNLNQDVRIGTARVPASSERLPHRRCRRKGRDSFWPSHGHHENREDMQFSPLQERKEHLFLRSPKHASCASNSQGSTCLRGDARGAINDRVEWFQFAVGSVDRVNKLAISVRETDVNIRSDFHSISPQRGNTVCRRETRDIT